MAASNWQEAVASAVRRQRAGLKISQERLAEMTGVSRVHISRIETGDTDITMAVFVKLASAFGMTPPELLRDAELAIPKRRSPKS